MDLVALALVCFSPVIAWMFSEHFFPLAEGWTRNLLVTSGCSILLLILYLGSAFLGLVSFNGIVFGVLVVVFLLSGRHGLASEREEKAAAREPKLVQGENALGISMWFDERGLDHRTTCKHQYEGRVIVELCKGGRITPLWIFGVIFNESGTFTVRSRVSRLAFIDCDMIRLVPVPRSVQNRCGDGTFSGSCGSGTCSHHGGVWLDLSHYF